MSKGKLTESSVAFCGGGGGAPLVPLASIPVILAKPDVGPYDSGNRTRIRCSRDFGLTPELPLWCLLNGTQSHKERQPDFMSTDYTGESEEREDK